MQNHLKAVLSAGAMAVFLLIAYASVSWDEIMATSTNTTVAIKDCGSDISISGVMSVDLFFTHTDGTAISNATGEIYITHQIVNDGECTFTVLQSIVQSFVTDSDGEFFYEGPAYLHNNSQDLFRVEVHIDSKPGQWDDWKSVKVKYYDNASFRFLAIAPDPL